MAKPAFREEKQPIAVSNRINLHSRENMAERN